MYLLDTNVLSELVRARPDPGVLEWINRQPRRQLFLSTVSLAEILRGLCAMPMGQRRHCLTEALEVLFRDLFRERLHSFDVASAHQYARVWVMRHRQGRPVAIADAQIAAIALARGLCLVTRNICDFEGIADLPLLNPWDS